MGVVGGGLTACRSWRDQCEKAVEVELVKENGGLKENKKFAAAQLAKGRFPEPSSVEDVVTLLTESRAPVLTFTGPGGSQSGGFDFAGAKTKNGKSIIEVRQKDEKSIDSVGKVFEFLVREALLADFLSDVAETHGALGSLTTSKFFDRCLYSYVVECV